MNLATSGGVRVRGSGARCWKEVQASRPILESKCGKSANQQVAIHANGPDQPQGQSQDLRKVQLEGSGPLTAAKRNL